MDQVGDSPTVKTATNCLSSLVTAHWDLHLAYKELDNIMTAKYHYVDKLVVCQMRISMSSDETGETARGPLPSGDLVLKDSLRHLDGEVSDTISSLLALVR